MDKNKIINDNINDLNIGYDLASIINNTNLKKYTIDRLKSINNNINLYQHSNILLLVNSYVIDLVLFINISNISKSIEEKDYFKGRLVDLMNIFPELKKRKDLIELI